MSDTHTHGLDDIACPERLVGECVIEREVAHAVAIERERVAAWVDREPVALYASPDDGDPDNAEFTLGAAIRRGTHDEATR